MDSWLVWLKFEFVAALGLNINSLRLLAPGVDRFSFFCPEGASEPDASLHEGIQVRLNAWCHGCHLSPISRGPVPVRATDICVFVEPLLCGEHFALGYHIVEVKPLTDGAYILVRKAKSKTKEGKKHEKLCEQLVISAKRKKKTWVRKEASAVRVGISQEEMGGEARQVAMQTQGT